MERGKRTAIGEASRKLSRVNIQPGAIADADVAAAWYEGQRSGLGIELILEFDAAIERAAEYPESYEILYRGVRRVLLRRFPYAMYYIIDHNIVEIFAVIHQHEEPSAWKSKIT